MSDPSGPGKPSSEKASVNAEASADDTSRAELLGPERNKPGEPPRKEPRIIDSRAEEISVNDIPKETLPPEPEITAEIKQEPESKKAEPEKPASMNPQETFSVQTGTTTSGNRDTRSTVEAARIPSRLPLFAALAALVLSGGAVFYLSAGNSDFREAETRIAALEAQGVEQNEALRGTARKLDEQAARADGASAMLQRIETLNQETGNLKQSLQESREKLDQVAGQMPPADIADQVKRIESMVGALSVAIDGLGPKVAQMEARVAALEEKKDDPDASGRAALGLALSNLARASETASPFARELEAIAVYLPQQKELAALAAAAEKGVPTRDTLKTRFPAMAQAALDAERRGAGKSFWANLVANARALVTIRRTGEITGNDTEAVLARMEERLKRDDLAAAVKEARLLKAHAASSAALWVADADARVRTDLLLRDLSAHVTERLARSSTAAASPEGVNR